MVTLILRQLSSKPGSAQLYEKLCTSFTALDRVTLFIQQINSLFTLFDFALIYTVLKFINTYFLQIFTSYWTIVFPEEIPLLVTLHELTRQKLQSLEGSKISVTSQQYWIKNIATGLCFIGPFYIMFPNPSILHVCTQYNLWNRSIQVWNLLKFCIPQLPSSLKAPDPARTIPFVHFGNSPICISCQSIYTR
jgi:hypothetical protein